MQTFPLHWGPRTPTTTGRSETLKDPGEDWYGCKAQAETAQLPISGTFSFVKPLRNAVVSHLQKMSGGIPRNWTIYPRAYRCHATAGDWHSMPRALGSFAKHECTPTPHPCPKAGAIQQEPREGRGLGVRVTFQLWPAVAQHALPPRQHGATVSEQSSLWSRTGARKAGGGLTLFRIFLPTSTTTYSITLSIRLRSTSRWMMEHSRPFSALRMIADGPVLHHSDENPWVQRYFISLQHVSAFSLPMMTIQ